MEPASSVDISKFIAEANLKGLNVVLSPTGELEFRDSRLRHPAWGVHGALSGHWKSVRLESLPPDFVTFVVAHHTEIVQFLKAPREAN
jgi:hypothetical protein